MKKSLILSCFLIFIFAVSSFAFSLNLNPPSLRLSTLPGETVKGKLVLENKGDTKLSIKTYTEDWVYGKDGSKDFKKAGTTKLSCTGWIKLKPGTFELNPKEIKEIEYILTTPKDSIGGHYAVIFFESVLSKTGASGVTIAGRIGTIVYQETKGNSIKKASISDLSASPSKTGEPLKATLSFKNEGNTQLQAEGKLILKDLSGKSLTELDIPRLYTLPGDIIKKDLQWPKFSIKKGRYIYRGELSYGDGQKAVLEKELDL